MTKKEYFIEIDKIVRDAIAALNYDKAEMDELEVKRADRRTYTYEHIQKVLAPKISTLRSDMMNVKANALNKIAKLSEEYAAELKSANNLDASLITDDVKLLNVGVTLTQKDLEDMFDRNSGNPTMEQIIERYAREKNVPLNRTRKLANEDVISAVESIPYVTERIIKWHDQPKFYAEFMAEGAELRTTFEG